MSEVYVVHARYYDWDDMPWIVLITTSKDKACFVASQVESENVWIETRELEDVHHEQYQGPEIEFSSDEDEEE